MKPKNAWVAELLKSDVLTWKAWVIDQGARGEILNVREVRRYLADVERFREGLLVAMHFLGGQAARAPEILNIRWVNTSYGGVRNIQIEDSLVSLVFVYHKGYNATGTSKVIYHYLPYKLGDVLVQYLWLVLPFCHMLESEMTGFTQISPFLWDKSFVYSDKVSDYDLRCWIWSSDKMRRII
jgi:hypothetical protein